ncbi:MAG: DUF1236 domain-containing protein [Hyphomicrobium sp.]|uniref:DUF1236 domain-containing protein n=1 Tax=Hyphomicrobium sp. TaxID=82 RepID=UPI0025BBD4A2|nr:DUF1236 domain-containing protein [Hyphomicrobium sp.]MBZ0209668.1 DUF1236 domain-containing protein [Hyphomicrobium sp.]
MKIPVLGVTAVVALLVGANVGITPAVAQHDDHETGSHGSTNTYTPAHGHMLREHGHSHGFASTHHRDFKVQVGAILPHSARFHPLPDDLVRQVPGARRHQYSIVNDRHVIVDPRTRRIVHVAE